MKHASAKTALGVCLLMVAVGCNGSGAEEANSDLPPHSSISHPALAPDHLPDIKVDDLSACSITSPKFWLIKDDNSMLLGDFMLPSPAWKWSYEVNARDDYTQVTLTTHPPAPDRMDFQVMSAREMKITLPNEASDFIAVSCVAGQ